MTRKIAISNDYRKQAVIPQAKILRMFGLLDFMVQRQPRHLKSIASEFDMSIRTVHRYFFLLNEIGFKINSDGNGFYRIHKKTMPDFIKWFQCDQNFKPKF